MSAGERRLAAMPLHAITSQRGEAGLRERLALEIAGFAEDDRQRIGRALGLVAAVTNPDNEPGQDAHRRYREHVAASLEASPWARVIKMSDFTDNGVSLIHATGPRAETLAPK